MHMNIKHLVTTCVLASSLLFAGCASTPKPAATPEPGLPGSNEPDLLVQLRERMAAGTLQRQEKTPDRKASEAAEDSSRSPVMQVSPAQQQAVALVAADYARALALMNANKSDEALALLQKIQQKAPSLSGPVVNQGIILMRQKKFAEAEKTLQGAVKINARNPYALNLIGVCQREQGQFAQARTSYEAALAIDPGYARAHFNLGVLADLYLQDLPLALRHYERYQSLQSKADPTVANWIVDLQKRTGVYKAPAPLPAVAETISEDGSDSATDAGSGPSADAAAPAADPNTAASTDTSAKGSAAP